MPTGTKDSPELLQELRRRYGARIAQGRLRVKHKALARLIESRGTTHTPLAKVVGENQGTLSHALKGARQLKAPVLYAISKELGCALYDIAHPPDGEDVVITPRDFELVSPSIREVANVHTLVLPSGSTGLNDWYYHTKVRQVGSSIAQRVGDLHELGETPALIEGVAGQGKSVFLKHLVLREVESQATLPLFLELQSFKGESIQEAVCSYLQSLELEVTLDQVDTLFQQGAVSLLLDGFDELRDEYREDIAAELAELHRRSPDLRIVVTSRPRSGIDRVACFERLEIEPLNYDAVMDLVRIYASEQDAEEIAVRLPDATPQIKTLLSTPLMVVLLVFHFSQKRTFPETLIDFYKDLPDLLINDQNSAPGGLKREIKSGLGSDELRHFLEALAFVWMETNADEAILVSDLEVCARKAMQLTQCDASPRLALDDLISVTNLIIHPDRRCRFLHLSIKEFYAAAYITTCDDEIAQLFYTRMLEGWWRRWEAVLVFLQSIDRDRCIEYFLLPGLHAYSPFTYEHYYALAQTVCVNLVFGPEGPQKLLYGITVLDPRCFAERREPLKTRFVSEGALVRAFGDRVGKRVIERLQEEPGESPVIKKGETFEDCGVPVWNAEELVRDDKIRVRAEQRILASELRRKPSTPKLILDPVGETMLNFKCQYEELTKEMANKES